MYVTVITNVTTTTQIKHELQRLCEDKNHVAMDQKLSEIKI